MDGTGEKNGVHFVVGLNFDKVVRDPTKDVFVNFNDSFNQVAAKVEEEWEAYAKVLKDIPNLIFATIDMTSNDIDGIRFEALPNSALFPMSGEHATNGIVMPPIPEA